MGDAITYADEFGDAITEYSPLIVKGMFGADLVVVRHNATGWRLLPPTCQPGCDGLVTFHVLRQHCGGRTGESQVFCCEAHLPDEARKGLAR